MSSPRQLILIMTDTQRTDMLGCYADTGVRTPNLDQLASRGVRFDRTYCCQPVCGPARSGLFTGTFPHSNGSWANSMPLGANVKTVGQRLRDNGVRTAYIGKWHLDGGDYFGLGRCPDGWDPEYWYDMRCYLDELPPEDRRRSRDPKLNRAGDVTPGFTFGHRCSNRAIRFLETHRDQSYFLVLSYDEPHGPHLCPPQFRAMYADHEFPRSPNCYDTLEGKPEHQQVWAGRTPGAGKPDPAPIRRPDFFGCNTFVDSEIGRVLDTVDRHAPDALVIYTADHGDGLGSHGLWGKGPVAYDEIARVPLIVRWPGHSPEGGVCEHPTSHIDVTPTVMDYFGLPVPKLLEGKSMLATMADPATATNDVVFVEFNRYEIDHDGFGGYQPLRAATDGRHKLVINLLSSDELYDLQTDPQEMKNRIASRKYAKVRNGLHDRILRWMDETRDPFRGYSWQRRPWRTDAPPATWACSGMTRQRENEEYEPRQLDYDTGLPMVEAVRSKHGVGRAAKPRQE